MKRYIIIYIIVVTYCIIIISNSPTSIYAAEEEAICQLEPIVVTPYKSPVTAYNSNRSVTSIGAEELEEKGFSSIAQFFSHTPGIDMQRRGRFGVQSDLSIRGANFEENTILIDGIRFNDPQTGHHDMDIPLTINDIEALEIVKGHASGIYGQDGFGGALNVVTRKPRGTEFKSGFSMGENEFFGNNLSLTFPIWALCNRLSFEDRRSGGWRDYTKFETTTFSFYSSADLGASEASPEQSRRASDINFHFGWKDNDFEADGFYSNLFPREEEHTDTKLLKLDAALRMGEISFEPKLYYRRHADKFILDKERRGWAENFHASYVCGTELFMHIDSFFGRFTLGAEIAKDKIESTNLGFHSHQREAVLLVLAPRLTDRLSTNASIRYDHFYKWGSQWSPSVDVGYLLLDSLKLRSSFGTSFRTPSFTELYYNSPANIGDESLRPQESWSLETGLVFKERGAAFQCDFFRREAEDTIDWMRADNTRPWRAQNIGEVETDGIEASVSFAPEELEEGYPLKLISISYGHLDSDREGAEDLDSKYVLNFLRHHLALRLKHALPLGFDGRLDLSYKDRVGHDGHFLLDASLSKKIQFKSAEFSFFVNATNLFNTFYTESEGTTPPARWIIGGLEAEF